jgi:hypothetical protein
MMLMGVEGMQEVVVELVTMLDLENLLWMLSREVKWRAATHGTMVMFEVEIDVRARMTLQLMLTTMVSLRMKKKFLAPGS